MEAHVKKMAEFMEWLLSPSKAWATLSIQVLLANSHQLTSIKGTRQHARANHVDLGVEAPMSLLDPVQLAFCILKTFLKFTQLSSTMVCRRAAKITCIDLYLHLCLWKNFLNRLLHDSSPSRF